MHIGANYETSGNEVGLNSHHRSFVSVGKVYDAFAVGWDARILGEVGWSKSASGESVRRHAPLLQIGIGVERGVVIHCKDAFQVAYVCWVREGESTGIIVGQAELAGEKGKAEQRGTQAMAECFDGVWTTLRIGKGKDQEYLGVDAHDVLVQSRKVQFELGLALGGGLQDHPGQVQGREARGESAHQRNCRTRSHGGIGMRICTPRWTRTCEESHIGGGSEQTPSI